MVGEAARYPLDLYIIQAVFIEDIACHLGGGNAAVAVYPAVPVKSAADPGLCQKRNEHSRNNQHEIIGVNVPEHIEDFLPVK